jgi:ketosteroid isomerase-like protein
VSEAENRATIERLGKALSEGDLNLFHQQFTDDSVMHYAQSGERIVGAENRRGIYGAFPSLPKVSPRHISMSGDLGVLEAQLDYGDGTDWRAVFIFEFRDGKIAKETAYWTQPFEAPEWRSAWVEPTD